jgi:hypothetical protein
MSQRISGTMRAVTALVIVFALVFCFYGCKKKNSETITDATRIVTSEKTVTVTDKNGETVTDTSGKAVTTTITVTKVVGAQSSSKTTAAKNTTANKTTTTKKTTTAKKTVTTAAKTTAAPQTTKAAVYAAPVIYGTYASGTTVYTGSTASIDASNTSDGYIMVRDYGSAAKAVVQVTGGGITNQYNLTPGAAYITIPLSMGSGTYTVNVLEQIEGTSYAYALSQSIYAGLSSQFAPFLRPNVYVNYNGSSSCVLKSAEICTGCDTQLAKVSAVYNYVVNNFKYNYTQAASSKSGYIPDLNYIFSVKTGICYDYAAIMTAMLRSQGIPTKMVFGNASGYGYHAWINTYINGTGWVNGIIYFDGNSWKLMDPTFASTGGSSANSYITNSGNYSAQHYY